MNSSSTEIGGRAAPAELRRFALSTGAAFVVVFGLLLPWAVGASWPTWPWILGGILATWGLVHAPSLAPVHRAWMKLADAMHRVMTPLVLGIVFFAIFVPLGLLMKAAGRDALRRRRSPAGTYRVPVDNGHKRSMENPF